MKSRTKDRDVRGIQETDLPESTQTALATSKPAYFCTVCVVSGPTSEERSGIWVKTHFDAEAITPPVQDLANLIADRVGRTVNRIPQRHLLRIRDIYNATGKPSLTMYRIVVTLDKRVDGLAATVQPCTIAPEAQHIVVLRNAGDHMQRNVASSLKDRGIKCL